MAQLVIPGAFQVSVHAKSSSQDVINVVGIRSEFSSAADVAAQVAAAWIQPSGPRSLMAVPYQLEKVRAVDLSSPNGQVAEVQVTGPGSQTGQLATNASCALVTFGSGTRNRSSKGRLYHGPLTETGVAPDGRTLQPAFQTAIRDAYLKFYDFLDVANMQWVVISRTEQTTNFINRDGIACQTTIATQRRRIRS